MSSQKDQGSDVAFSRLPKTPAEYFTRPPDLPDLSGVEVLSWSTVQQQSSTKASFSTWSKLDFGLVLAVGSVTSYFAPSELIVPVISAAVPIAANVMSEPDPFFLLDSLNDYLAHNMSGSKTSVAMSVMIWDSFDEGLVIGSAGEIVTYIYTATGEVLEVLEAEDYRLGVSACLDGLPTVVEPSLGDVVIMSSGNNSEASMAQLAYDLSIEPKTQVKPKGNTLAFRRTLSL